MVKYASFPASLQDEFSLATIPDTACLANFRLCLWHEPRRAKSFIYKTFDYYFPGIFEDEKGVKLFKVPSRRRTFQGSWAGRKKRQRTAAVQDANAHTPAITFAPSFWRFLQRPLPDVAAVDARNFFQASFQDEFPHPANQTLGVWLISSCACGTSRGAFLIIVSKKLIFFPGNFRRRAGSEIIQGTETFQDRWAGQKKRQKAAVQDATRTRMLLKKHEASCGARVVCIDSTPSGL